MQEHVFCDLFSSMCDSIKNDKKKTEKKNKRCERKIHSQEF